MASKYAVSIRGGMQVSLVNGDAVLALVESRGQCTLSIRGADRTRLAIFAATILTRLYELDPPALAVALEMIRKGSIAEIKSARDQQTGTIHPNLGASTPQELGAEVAEFIRTFLTTADELPEEPEGR